MVAVQLGISSVPGLIDNIPIWIPHHHQLNLMGCKVVVPKGGGWLLVKSVPHSYCVQDESRFYIPTLISVHVGGLLRNRRYPEVEEH